MTARRIRVLIVDDHPLMLEGLKGRLSRAPTIEVVGEAESARQALDLLREISPTLVLTDIGMKDMTGIELTQEVTRRYPEVAVLILSMYDDPEYVQQAMQAGARGYVLKGGRSEHLVSAIESVASGGTYLSSAIADCLFRPRSGEGALTSREQEILAYLADGQSSKQIAKALYISVRTVESHRLSIKRKVNIDGQAELIKFAVERRRPYSVKLQ